MSSGTTAKGGSRRLPTQEDVVNTYRVWLRYELFRGRLSDANVQASEANLIEFVQARGNLKPHLANLM